MRLRLSLFSAILATAAMTSAFAETREIRINKQFGLTYLAINVAVEKSLIEKHVRAAGLGEVKITFPQLASGASTNDALLSGNLDIASGSTPNLFLLSERTRGRQRRAPTLEAARRTDKLARTVIRRRWRQHQKIGPDHLPVYEWRFKRHTTLDICRVSLPV